MIEVIAEYIICYSSAYFLGLISGIAFTFILFRREIK